MGKGWHRGVGDFGFARAAVVGRGRAFLFAGRGASCPISRGRELVVSMQVEVRLASSRVAGSWVDGTRVEGSWLTGLAWRVG